MDRGELDALLSAFGKNFRGVGLRNFRGQAFACHFGAR
jgi:hypothetical protein